jgi:hypothetical protein
MDGDAAADAIKKLQIVAERMQLKAMNGGLKRANESVLLLNVL